MGIKRIMVCLALLGALSSVGDNFVVNPGFEVIDGKDGAVGWRGPSKPFSYVLGEGRNGEALSLGGKLYQSGRQL